MKAFVKYKLLAVLLFNICALASNAQSKKDKESAESRVSFDILFMNANKEKMLGNYEKALNLFLECEKKDLKTMPCNMHWRSFICKPAKQ